MKIPTSILDEFPQQKGLIYLNHAAVSPWPKRVAHAVSEFAEENINKKRKIAVKSLFIFLNYFV